ncbi:MAG: urease accessory protein UreE [Alistipes sp.]|nr:urease accessory protein UreE [Alistipes sp.]
MRSVKEILGNIASKEWEHRASLAEVIYLDLDQWTAQRSRFLACAADGEEYAISLPRNTRLKDGDVIDYDKRAERMTVVRLKLADMMVVDLGTLSRQPLDEALRVAVELGHALGNQHWAAVVRGTKVYVPLMVDRKVMESVMRTHSFDHIFYSFRPAHQIIPYLSPHEVRRLLGATHSTDHHHATDAK